MFWQLNNLQRLICIRPNQPTNQKKNLWNSKPEFNNHEQTVVLLLNVEENIIE